MSDNKTVPSAREFAINYLRECREEKVSPLDDYNLGMEFEKFTRLHLEEMRDGICKEVYLDNIERSDIIEAFNNYIKNIK